MREVQASLSLGFGQLRWDNLPPQVREEVLVLWMRLLREHLERRTDDAAKVGT